jgi:hypothetical protein
MKRHISISVVLFGLCAAVPAAAEDSPARLLLRQRSQTTGFTRASVSPLTRLVGPGNDAAAGRARDVARVLVGRTLGYAQRRNGNTLRQSTAEWRLRVSDNGNNVHLALERKDDVPIAAMAKPTLSEIEGMGRAFITTSMSRIVTLGPNEELVFLGSRYEYSGGQSIDSGVRDPDVLEGWTSIFGRSIGGEVVIGPGSKVVVMFRADGAVEGFDLDWPAYTSSGAAMETLRVAAVRQRGAQLKARLPQLADVAQRSAVHKETAFECGLFDRGGRSKRGSAEMVQPACQETFRTEMGAAGNKGTVLVVPAARVPIADDSWVEARTLCAAGDLCQARRVGW